MKRITSWPQAVLGLAFSWGALMGWAATYGALAPPALLLYASAFCWTIGYDTVYALQDARDDAIIGIKSTARLFGAHARLGVGAVLRRLARCSPRARSSPPAPASSPRSAGRRSSPISVGNCRRSKA